MTNIFSLMKKNWVVVAMGVVILFLLLRNSLGFTRYSPAGGVVGVGYSEPSLNLAKSVPSGGFGRQVSQPAPTERSDRITVENTNMSMLVKDVAVVLKEIEKQAVAAGGYMVSKNISKPEGAANGYISLRVPTGKREETMEVIRGLGVKVVSENVNGYDVTDEYVDIEGRIASLSKTKAKIEAIMDRATKVSDLMDVQIQLTNIEQQIDNYKGQQKYLEQTAKLTLVSVSLSTDELSLPYAPDKAWRPAVVFKLAVRSLVGTLRDVGSAAIWIVVYTPVWGVLLGAIYLFKKVRSRKSTA